MIRVAFLLSLFIGGIIYSVFMVVAVFLIVNIIGSINNLIASKIKLLLFDNMKHVL